MSILDQLNTEIFVYSKKIESLDCVVSIDTSTKTVEMKQSFKQQVHQNKRYIEKISEAMDRIDHDSFGKCKDCGLVLDIDRLLANPSEILCMFCKEEELENQRQLLKSQNSNVSLFPTQSFFSSVGSEEDNLEDIKVVQ